MSETLLIAAAGYVVTLLVAVGGWVFGYRMQTEARRLARLEKKVHQLETEVRARIALEKAACDWLAEFTSLPDINTASVCVSEAIDPPSLLAVKRPTPTCCVHRRILGPSWHPPHRSHQPNERPVVTHISQCQDLIMHMADDLQPGVSICLQQPLDQQSNRPDNPTFSGERSSSRHQ